jgi:hypothetical protein
MLVFAVGLVLVPSWVVVLDGLAGGFALDAAPYDFAVLGLAAVCVVLALAAATQRGPAVTRVGAALVLGLAGGAVALSGIGLALFSPMALLDDSGHALVNAGSLALSGVLAGAFGVTLVAAAVSSRGRRGTLQLDRRGAVRVAVSVAVIGVTMGVAAVVGWTGAQRQDSSGIPAIPSQQWMQSRPEASLVPPGALGVETSIGGERRARGGSDEARAVAYFSSNLDPAGIRAWYRDRLLAGGWRVEDQASLSSWTANDGYARGTREIFTVAVLTHNLPSGGGRTSFESDYTVFGAR